MRATGKLSLTTSFPRVIRTENVASTDSQQYIQEAQNAYGTNIDVKKVQCTTFYTHLLCRLKQCVSFLLVHYIVHALIPHNVLLFKFCAPSSLA